MNKLEIIIQEAEKKDAAALIQYVRQIADETDFLTFDSSEFNKTIEEEELIIEQHKMAKNRIFIIAFLNNKIIGILNVNSSKKKRLEHIGEFGMSVLKEYWNQGVGGSLLKFMINWAEKSDVIKKLNLKVLVENESAIRLYKKNGFILEGTVRRDIKLNDSFHDTYQMGLLIN